MEPTLVLFAIQAGIRLGRKVYDVMVEKNFDRPLLFPMGDLAGDPLSAAAQNYFDDPENPKNWDWVKKGGPLNEIYKKNGPLAAYQTLLGLTEVDTSWKEAREIISGLQEFAQYKDNQPDGTKQILGLVVDIGIDFLKVNPYFKIDPQSLQSGSAPQRVIGAFVTNLDDINFEDTNLPQIGGMVLQAGLEVFGENANLVTRDKGLQLLFRDVTNALIEDFKTGTDQNFLERITGSLLRGAMTGITENPVLFIRGDSKEKKFIRKTVTDVLNGLKGQEHLFTPTSVEIIFKNALVAVSEAADLITEDKFLEELIGNTLKVLLTKNGQKVFSEATFAAVVQVSLETLGKNVGSLVKLAGPERQFLVHGLTALTESLGTTLKGSDLTAIFSSNQLLDLTRVVLGAVAQHPQALLGESARPQDSVLANLITAVAGALQADPTKIISGEAYLQILQAVLQVGMQNANKILLPLDPSKSLSAPVHQLLKGLLELAPDLAGGLNSGNFPKVFEKLLLRYLFDDLKSLDKNNLIESTKTILLSTL